VNARMSMGFRQECVAARLPRPPTSRPRIAWAVSATTGMSPVGIGFDLAGHLVAAHPWQLDVHENEIRV